MVRINIHVSFVDNYEIGFLEYILDPNLEDGEWHPETKVTGRKKMNQIRLAWGKVIQSSICVWGSLTNIKWQVFTLTIRDYLIIK